MLIGISILLEHPIRGPRVRIRCNSIRKGYTLPFDISLSEDDNVQRAIELFVRIHKLSYCGSVYRKGKKGNRYEIEVGAA